MVRLAILFLILALLAAFFGFGGSADYSSTGVQILAVVFLVFSVMSYLASSYYQRRQY